MNTKLAINLKEGTVQAEGGEDFVRFIYQDFKESLSKHVSTQPPRAEVIEPPSEKPLLIDQNKEKKKPRGRAANSSDSDKKSAEYKPSFNTNLNLVGLEDFYEGWHPTNNSEKILLFAIFLRDQLQMNICTADDIYTCFFTMNRKGKTKIPSAFVQAFHNAQSRTHYIKFSSLQEVEVTIPGQNHYTSKKSAP